MGFFSWKTQDTNRSITNCHLYERPTFKVIMTDNKGNKYVEENYDGYGVFGDKDYYELLAEMNGKSTREEGIDLEFKEEQENVIYPSLSECGEYFNGKKPENCEYQGYFYDDEEEDL